VTEALYSSSAPIFELDGEAKGELGRDLLRLDVEEATDGLKSLSARFLAVGPAQGSGAEQLQYVDGKILDFGKKLTVSIGPPGQERTIFAGLVSGLELAFEEGGEPSVSVFAEDELMKLRMTRRMRTYEQVSDADLARKLASEHGLSADAAADGPTYDVVQQWNQSDLAFLRERARSVDAEVWVSGRTLSVKAHANRRGDRLRMGYGHELMELTVLADLAHQRSSVTVTGWDVAGKQAVSERADQAAIDGELGGGDSGGSVLAAALAERRETVSHAVPLSGDEARARAEAQYRERARRFVRGRGIAQTDPKLRVGTTLQLDGLGPLFSGDYYVAEVIHRFDGEHGLRTEFVVERPGLGRAA
jgi:Bacteriophage probable baseplate hub protein